MGRVEGKVALVTGAARGQGRSHAVRLAQEGADIVALDICRDLKTVRYDGATEADLAETATMIEDLDRRVISRRADVRDLSAMESAVAEAVSEFGRLDIVVANAGIATAAPAWELTEEMFQEMIDVNLTGVWKTVKPAIPVMIEQGSGVDHPDQLDGGAGRVRQPRPLHGRQARRRRADAHARRRARPAQRSGCNSVHPTTVDTPMIQNDVIRELFLGRTGATREEASGEFKGVNALPIPWVEAIDISNAVLYLASDEARYVTGHTQVVDAGGTAPYRNPNV